MFLKDLKCLNTGIVPLKHPSSNYSVCTITLNTSASTGLWLTGAQVVLFGVSWALLSHIYWQRKPPHQHSSCPSSQHAAAAFPFQRVSTACSLTDPLACTADTTLSNLRLFFLCSPLPPLSTVLFVCLAVCSQCARSAAPRELLLPSPI